MRKLTSSGMFLLMTTAGLGALTPPAHAQTTDMTQYVTEDVVKAPAKESDLKFTLTTNASAAFASNKDVVGEVDGFSTLFGMGVSAGLQYMNGPHSWTNTFTISESWARTPALERFTKNNDQVQLESLYNYFLLEWFGPFARLNFETSAFDTTVLTAEEKDYQILRLDGTTDLTTTDQLKLSDALSPLTLSQSVGLFAEPLRSSALTWKLRLGAGARQTFAEGVLALDDDKDTDQLEVKELADVFQAGLEGFTGAEGKFSGGRLSYFAGASVLIPFINNDDTGRTPIELLRWGLKAGLHMSVTEWMGLNYNLSLLSDPQMIDKTQVQNNLLLTFKYTLFGAEEEIPLTAAEQAEDFRKKAIDAEKQAIEFREKALEAEKKAKEEAAREQAKKEAAIKAQQAKQAQQAADQAQKQADDAQQAAEDAGAK